MRLSAKVELFYCVSANSVSHSLKKPENTWVALSTHIQRANQLQPNEIIFCWKCWGRSKSWRVTSAQFAFKCFFLFFRIAFLAIVRLSHARTIRRHSTDPLAPRKMCAVDSNQFQSNEFRQLNSSHSVSANTRIEANEEAECDQISWKRAQSAETCSCHSFIAHLILSMSTHHSVRALNSDNKFYCRCAAPPTSLDSNDIILACFA